MLLTMQIAIAVSVCTHYVGVAKSNTTMIASELNLRVWVKMAKVKWSYGIHLSVNPANCNIRAYFCVFCVCKEHSWSCCIEERLQEGSWEMKWRGRKWL